MAIDNRLGGELILERQEGIATLTINRPARLNALTVTLVKTLRETFSELDSDAEIRAIVLTGAGRAFSAGADIRDASAGDADILREFYNPLIVAMAEMSTPLVAAINGVTIGVSVSLALACDLRVAAQDATFQLPYVNVGLVPDGGATWLLSRAVGSARAAEMLLLGRPVSAEHAFNYGLVNRVAPRDAVLASAMELARVMASASSAVGAARRLLNGALSRDLISQLEAEATAQLVAKKGADFIEAKRAFAEKRPPKFR